jgi:hypothetical protein
MHAGGFMKTLGFGTIGAMAVVFFAFHLAARPAFGDAILTSDNRFVSTSGSWHINPFCCSSPASGSWNSSASPSPAFANFNSTVEAPNPNGLTRPQVLQAWAQQVSSVTPNDFEVFGTARMYLDVSYPNASFAGAGILGSVASVFDVGFDLLQPHYFQLISRIDPINHVYIQKSGVTVLSAPFSVGYTLTTGLLDPGSYLFHADNMFSCSNNNGDPACKWNADPAYNNAYQFSFKLQTQPFQIQDLPEPSTIIQLAASLLALAGFVTFKR